MITPNQPTNTNYMSLKYIYIQYLKENAYVTYWERQYNRSSRSYFSAMKKPNQELDSCDSDRGTIRQCLIFASQPCAVVLLLLKTYAHINNVDESDETQLESKH